MTVLQGTAAAAPRPRRQGAGFWRALRGNRKATAGSIILFIFVVISAFPGLFTSVRDANALVYPPRLGPSTAHLLGTTGLGQDIYSQLVYGTRQSLIIAVVAGFFATVLSVLIGVSAAYLGGFLDDLLSMLTNVVLVIPAFPLIIILAKYAGHGSLTVLLVVLIVTGWAYGANQMRAQALSLRNRDFLESARVRGERRSYIIVFEVLPTMTSLIVANFLGAALYSVLSAAGLQFLGLGDPNSQSWGTMLYWAQNQQALQTGAALWSIAPGLCVALLGAAFALMNYAFDEIGNPALRPVKARRRAVPPPTEADATVEPDGDEPRSGEPYSEEPYSEGPGSEEPGGDAPLLRVRGLTVEYATARGASVAVAGVDLDVRRGEFVGVVGESGCGKSTLLFAIARLLSPPARTAGGSVTFKGGNLVAMTEKQLNVLRWRDYSVVMQSAMNALNPVRTIGAQFKDAIDAHADYSAERIRERSVEVMKLVGIDPAHLKSYPHQLSGGMRQRAMIAMALLFTPDLVIMDEPTSALDVVAQRSLMVQIKELQQLLGFAVLFVTHDMSPVSRFSDRLLVMYAGQVVEAGPTRTVFDAPSHPYSRGLLDAFPSIHGERVELRGIPGSPPDLGNPPSGCRFHPRCPVAEEQCRHVEPPVYRIGEVDSRCLLLAPGRQPRPAAPMEVTS
ncbi:MAG TPA: dipeptide/oligopeptide/nickel ABC transporter permease/ATP-binding protein [Actinocrinis sp.]|uniref:dipeptide/oligopeptide/nickel ABC transporter permease/ATP-binding protein n=1 Tax=Actinocrinis sp. TaxID=1920516 RepID=UPI002DDD0B64|nr:dipeptide/oligopeptide/nickel ABC transporter permease/ATP-binding protein [Actinocrinis sp.]HEV2346694.1 dipeptide/oligopeptide/nickel ABC transporter permease/ATP-binding protein [Actinocrinis sp.]